MCGRFCSALPADELARIFATLGPVPNLPPNWNLAPTQPAVGVRRHPDTGARTLSVLTWGLLPHFEADAKAARRPINARAETVATQPLFRGAFARRRCLIPADAYYEWMADAGGKQPYAIARADGAPLALGGLWEGHRSPDGEVTRSFAIITVAASPDLRLLHERMPLVLEAPDWPAWLGETESDPRLLLRAAPPGTLRFWKVGRAVNSVRNNGASLLAPDPSPANAA
jgi:putative SOS response-associated peptidase YedK